MTDTGEKRTRSKLILGAIVGFMFAVPVAILIVRVVSAPIDYADILYKDGFNYDLFRDEKNYRSKLKSGLRIDTGQFKAQDGADLKGAIGAQEEVVMLLAYDPKCSICSKAGVQIREVSKGLSSAGIGYFVISFSTLQNPSEFYGAAGALGVGRSPFVWAGSGPDGNFSFDPLTPSHVLISRDGTILRVWPGVMEDKEAQVRMASQILTDTQAIVDALLALKHQGAEAAAQQVSGLRPPAKDNPRPSADVR